MAIGWLAGIDRSRAEGRLCTIGHAIDRAVGDN